MNYQTTPPQLNFRKQPKVSQANIIAVLPQGQRVEKISGGTTGWWKVKTEIGGNTVEGYVSSSYLKKINVKESTPEPDIISSKKIPAVHLKENDPSVKRSNTRWAFPLGEPDMPRRKTGNIEEKIKSIHEVIQFLNVEKSARYQPKTSSTYCNIYAYDYSYLTGAYIPRVWWRSKAIENLRKGEKVQALYGTTLQEMNANALFNWFVDYGKEFKWKRVFDLETLQLEANKGKVCIICAIRVNQNESGHIVAVVPETNAHKALRVDSKVSIPLQSQAGRNNKKYFTQNWWSNSRYREFGFWVHE